MKMAVPSSLFATIIAVHSESDRSLAAIVRASPRPGPPSWTQEIIGTSLASLQSFLVFLVSGSYNEILALQKAVERVGQLGAGPRWCRLFAIHTLSASGLQVVLMAFQKLSRSELIWRTQREYGGTRGS